MCETKKMIGDTLHDIMQKKQVNRITVHDIMDRSGMKRQSFYYHFQDIYDVLDWELDRLLFARLKYDADVTFDEWLDRAVDIIMADKTFFYRALEAEGREKAMKLSMPAAELYIGRMVTGRDVSVIQLNESEKFLTDFLSEALINYVLDQIEFKRKLTDGQIRLYTSMIIKNASRYMHDGNSDVKKVYMYSGEKEVKKIAVSF